MKTYTAIKHGFITRIDNANFLVYDVVVWTNDGDPKPTVVGIRHTKLAALEFGKKWVDQGGRIAKHGVLGEKSIPLLLT